MSLRRVVQVLTYGMGGAKIPLILGESQEVLRVVARQQSVPVFVWRLSDQMRVDQSGFLRRFVEFTG